MFRRLTFAFAGFFCWAWALTGESYLTLGLGIAATGAFVLWIASIPEHRAAERHRRVMAIADRALERARLK